MADVIGKMTWEVKRELARKFKRAAGGPAARVQWFMYEKVWEAELEAGDYLQTRKVVTRYTISASARDESRMRTITLARAGLALHHLPSWRGLHRYSLYITPGPRLHWAVQDYPSTVWLSSNTKSLDASCLSMTLPNRKSRQAHRLTGTVDTRLLIGAALLSARSLSQPIR